MRKPILQTPDDRLRKKAAPAVLDGKPVEELQATIRDLRDTFETTPNCAGLAAPQIGVGLRVVIVDPSPYRCDTYLMVDPVITNASENFQLVNDGCMSIGNGTRRARTLRPKRIEVSWLDENLLPRRQKFSGFIAACIHHEIDHLNGVLFIDRVRG
jgi:peptide deformylase